MEGKLGLKNKFPFFFLKIYDFIKRHRLAIERRKTQTKKTKQQIQPKKATLKSRQATPNVFFFFVNNIPEINLSEIVYKSISIEEMRKTCLHKTRLGRR